MRSLKLTFLIAFNHNYKKLPFPDNNSNGEPQRESKRFAPENKNLTHDELNNELQLIFALRKNREDIKINQLPDVYIDERSSAKDVADWLRQKEFSENVVKKLEHVNGRDLFSTQLDTLIEYFGPKTGKRLDGMIIIQKKHCKVSLDIIYFLIFIFLSRFYLFILKLIVFVCLRTLVVVVCG